MKRIHHSHHKVKKLLVDLLGQGIVDQLLPKLRNKLPVKIRFLDHSVDMMVSGLGLQCLGE